MVLAERLAALDLLPKEPDDALGAAAGRRLRLLGFALSRGVGVDALIVAMQSYGDLLAAFDDLAPPPLPDADMTSVGAELGLASGLVREIALAIGAGADEPLTVDDVDALRAAKQAMDLGLSAGVTRQEAETLGR